MITRIWPALLAFLTLFTLLPTTGADDTKWVTVEENGETVYLRDDRRPALYTQNFGDCMGGSLVNVSRFDAAYYADNATVLFHLEGSSAIANESLVMYIGVYAYGESRFDLVFNPCRANIRSLCPLNSSIPINANGFIPIAPGDIANIPSLAYDIPDFEGQAILRIFANSTQSEIGCYSAVVTNGKSFSHPESVGTVLGIFALITVLASFATAIYGEAVPTMRLHYAHSLSAGVVMAVFQHIFFTGALSVNWPSVLVAWWSNFAWAGGMIYSSSMQSSINSVIGANIGNTSQVGAAPSDSTQDNLGGGYDISSIYKRSFSVPSSYLPANHPFRRDMLTEIFDTDEFRMVTKRDIFTHHAERALAARDVVDKSDGYRWYGHAVGPGLPLPGNYSGFAGTLAEENIPVSNAFMTGFLWFLILLVLLVAAVVTFKGALEGLARFNAINAERLRFFRDHWKRYAGAVALRTCYIGFFLMMFLTIFEFTYQSSAGVKVVAAFVFVIFLVGISGVAWYACYYKKHLIIKDPGSAAGQVERKKLLGVIPVAAKKDTTAQTGETQATETSRDEKKSGKAFWKRKSATDSIANNPDSVDNIHDYDDYTMKFGWLVSRFRRSRWYFFTVWIFYEFLRAVFYAGASGYALAQVFGLLIIEFLAFIYIIWARPFEGRRLNLLVVYCLGFSKVASVALSAAFDVHFNLERITTTVIGIVIVIIQGILTIITMIAVIVGAISSYMSISRNREDFRPRKWHGLREKYFDHLDRVVNDLPREPKPKRVKRSERERQEAEESQPGFAIRNMRRENKIEDDDTEFASEMRPQDPNASYVSMDRKVSTPPYGSGAATPVRQSRAGSMHSMSNTNLPYGARPHRPSWSTRDFSMVGADESRQSFTPIDMSRTVPDEDEAVAPPSPKKGRHSRSASLSSVLHKSSAPALAVKQQPSSDSFQVGGDVSTRDTIGRVPAPSMRPRSNTHGSRNSRTGTPSYVFDERDDEYDDAQPGPSSQRASRYPLTPAQEMEEWSTPKVSQEER
ncbi:uncharacterized protein LTR77_000407 [Saxophila tyrrhenica]|uniref:ML-like domain-containing protein n=1 Tax=Saxophila tyrrhenica TaxID=1690608 RepID=A0AAV9PR75_9PEZI|nr:hypothetical protein LTR77_000407 [Saxophila tyrrhenica]